MGRTIRHGELMDSCTCRTLNSYEFIVVLTGALNAKDLYTHYIEQLSWSYFKYAQYNNIYVYSSAYKCATLFWLIPE